MPVSVFIATIGEPNDLVHAKYLIYAEDEAGALAALRESGNVEEDDDVEITEYGEAVAGTVYVLQG